MFKLFSRSISVLFISFLTIFSTTQQASSTQYSSAAAAPVGDYWRTTTPLRFYTEDEICNIDWFIYTPDRGAFTPTSYSSPSGEPRIGSCAMRVVGSQGGGISNHGVDRVCITRDNGVTAIHAGGTCAEIRNLCVKKGNPIELGSGDKVEAALDWRSPLDERFGFMRQYRSSADFDGSLSTRPFGHIWATEWAASVEGYSLGLDGSTSDWWFHAPDGTKYGFTTGGAPRRSDHKYTMTVANAAFGNRKTVEDGSGKLWVFGAASVSGGPQPLDEVHWPDGYKVTLTTDVDGNLSAMADNRGQRAEFTWVLNVILNSSGSEIRRTYDVTNIEIDTDYDGVTLLPEVELQYTYAAPLDFDKRFKKLTSVDLVDHTSSTTELVWQYEYADRDYYPILLTKIYDGRTDAGGALIVKSIFGYDAEGEAISTEHTGGVDLNIITYNVDGTVTGTNPLGKDTTFHFTEINGRNRATQVDGIATASCLGTTKALDYTANAGGADGYVYQRTERNGAITDYTRDARGLVLTKTEDANGASPRVTTFQWDATLRLPTQRVTSQLQEDFTYTASGLLLTYTQTDVLVGSTDLGKIRTTTYVYTTLASGLEVLTSVDGPGLLVDGVTDIVAYEYDADGNLIKATDANGLITEILTLSVYGQPELIRQSDGVEWGFTYDNEGRVLTTILDPNGTIPKITTYGYDIIGQLTSLTNTRGNIWTYAYDGAKRLTNITDPNGDEVNYTYDNMGNIINTAYSDGVNAATFSEAVEYDELGRVMRSVGAQGQIWNSTYDVEDNLATITDPASNTITNGYDALNRVVDVLDRAGGTTLAEYDDSDQQTRYTDPRSIDTTTSYNGFGDVLSETSADRGSMSYIYNNRGLVTSMLDARGITSNYEYDNGGRLTAKRFPATPAEDVTFEYDHIGSSGTNLAGVGKIFRVDDETGWTKTYYNKKKGTPSSRVHKVEGEKYTVKYNYDEEGNLDWITYPSGKRIDYTYNGSNEVRKIRWRQNEQDVNGNYPAWEDIVKWITYLPNGPLKKLNYEDGAKHENFYDSSYRLTRVKDTNGAIVNYDKSYSYDTRDDLATITDALDPLNDEVFTHTPRQFLATANGPYDDHVYEYDAVGNRDRQLITESGGFVKIYNHVYPVDSNRLDHVNEPARFVRQFTYDTAGNTTYDLRNDGGWGFVYNDANRMNAVTLDGVVRATFKYSAEGHQTVRNLTYKGIVVHAVHDLDGNRIAEYRGDSGALLAEYIWLNGQLVAAIADGIVFYARTDHIGRPMFSTIADGTVIGTGSWEPFGALHASTGPTLNLRFPGQWFGEESGLNQNWMRDYDPTLGRYIQADPLGLVDGASVYGYARQSPNRYTDPRGENARCIAQPRICIGIGTAIGEAVFETTLGRAAVRAIAAAIVNANAADDGNNAESDEAAAARAEIAIENGQCPDPCDDAKRKLKKAKENAKKAGGCRNLPKGSGSIAAQRASVWRELLFARANRDNICHQGPDTGHGMAQTQALNAMRTCLSKI